MSEYLTSSEALTLERLRLAEEEAESPIPFGSSDREAIDNDRHWHSLNRALVLGPDERGDD